jgi:uncharacterized protein YkwD
MVKGLKNMRPRSALKKVTMKPLVYLWIIILLSGCVSRSKYNAALLNAKKKQEKINALTRKNNALQEQYNHFRDSVATANEVSAASSKATADETDKKPKAGEKASAGTGKPAANTKSAAAVNHNSEESEVLKYLNIARTRPQYFLQTYVLPNNPDTGNSYVKSLIATLRTMKPVPALLPDEQMRMLALCHAEESGKTGYVGHTRQANCKKGYNAECCAYGSYGRDEALHFVLQFLVDEGVPSLGHRDICLASWVHRVGISIQPHKTYGKNAVLDFII